MAYNPIERLSDEWRQHGKIIIAVDYDDTISPWKMSSQEDCDKVIADIKEAKLTGAFVAIFTACHEDRYDEIRKYCMEHDLIIDSINEPPILLPYGHQRKIYANIFLDDRAGLKESLNILREAMYRMRAYNASKSLDNPGTQF